MPVKTSIQPPLPSLVRAYSMTLSSSLRVCGSVFVRSLRSAADAASVSPRLMSL